MKKIFVGWLAIFLLYASVQAADKIRIGFPDFSSPFLSLPLGQKPGFFQQEGIQAEFIRIRSTVALTALVSGELDYHTVLGPGFAAAVRGAAVKIVACYTPIVATALTNGDIASVDDTLVRHVIRKPFDVNAVVAALNEAVADLHAKATFQVAEPTPESAAGEGEAETPDPLNVRPPS